jgi:hypothetical protein
MLDGNRVNKFENTVQEMKKQNKRKQNFKTLKNKWFDAFDVIYFNTFVTRGRAKQMREVY